jgi:putative ABC transport system permease protein
VLDAARLPGVIAAEPVRNVRARVRAHGREARTGVSGIEPDARLSRPLDLAGRPVPLKGRGLLLSDALADRIGVRPGDLVELEITDGRRPTAVLPVTAVDRDYAGLSVFMARRELNRLMGEGDVASGAHLQVASDRRPAFYRAVTRAPQIVGAISRDDTIQQFRTSVADTMTIEMAMFLGFAVAIAFGVAFNVSRVALSERARDLATLRVLGFDRKECAYILLGELLILALLAAPLGVGGGYALATGLEAAFSHEDLRLPLVMGARAYGISFGAYLGTLIVAAALVGQRIGTLDLVAVLKTRE